MKQHKGKKVAGGKFVDVEEDANALEVIRVQKPKVVATVSGLIIRIEPFFRRS
jgi:hypothetical protein